MIRNGEVISLRAVIPIILTLNGRIREMLEVEIFKSNFNMLEKLLEIGRSGEV